MKTTLLSLFLTASLFAGAQNAKPKVAVLGIDSRNLTHDKGAVAYLVKLETEKTGKFSVMEKYDMIAILNKNNIDYLSCMDKECLVQAGKVLQVDKMISGSAELLSDKIVITLRMINVASGETETSNVSEFLNIPNELQRMTEIAVKRLLGIEPDPKNVSLLEEFDRPIDSPTTTLSLNGPRMGASMTLGENGKRLSDPLNEGGFDMFPVMSQFGWQFEKQYMSAGDFQGLLESVFMIGGLENGKMIPSFTFLNGFRFSKSGWEIGFGPSFRVIKKANGFYDTHNYLKDGEGEWHLTNEYNQEYFNDTLIPQTNPYEIVSRLDSRGIPKLSTGLVIVVGKTFRSGYLNIPVNAYVSPRKEGTFLGLTMGFNIARSTKN